MLDSSVLITAERRKLPVDKFIETVLNEHGTVELSLSPVTVAELVHGIYRKKRRTLWRGDAGTSSNYWTWFHSTR